jgi:hypothetical protein
MEAILPGELNHPAVFSLLQLSIAEDLSEKGYFSDVADSPADADITSRATLPISSNLRGLIRAKA